VTVVKIKISTELYGFEPNKTLSDKCGEECALHEVFDTGKPCNCKHEHIAADGSKICGKNKSVFNSH
jgi:hypothetical protein